MSNKIIVNYEKSIEKLLEKLHLMMANQEGELKGNKTSGDFFIKSVVGVFKGSYSVKQSIINIEIEKKPFLISKKLIEIEVKKFLDNN